MTRAVWNEKIIAESDNTIVVEGNHYFPPDSVRMEFLEKSDTRSTCPWKGQARYYNLKAGEKENKDAAWYYPEPSKEASRIKNHIAFWKGVRIEE